MEKSIFSRTLGNRALVAEALSMLNETHTLVGFAIAAITLGGSGGAKVQRLR